MNTAVYKNADPVNWSCETDDEPGKICLIDLHFLFDSVGKNFHDRLFSLIREKGLTDVEVYKRVGMDRKLFSKIRNNPDYHPKKSTVLVLAIALGLDLQETKELLRSAEYAFSASSERDLIVQYFISHGEYDLKIINNALSVYGQQALQ